MKIALIGAHGQLGTDIQKVFAQDDFFSVTPLSHKDMEITDIQNGKTLLEQIVPDVVINTSAYHKVDEVEENPDKAFLVNATAEKNLAELCNRNNWALVFLSTDYVFGLETDRNIPYKETDSPGPLNMYGLSKLAGEYATRYIAPKHFVIRVCGLFGTAGASGKGGGNIVDSAINLVKEKGEINVDAEQFFTPTYTKNVAENLKELLKTDAYGLYHMTSEGACSRWEFVQEIFNQLRMKVKCNKVDARFFKTRSRRPKYSVLEKYNLNKINLNKMRDWKENLTSYLKEKGYLS